MNQNRLAQTNSPYLQQHADNPVDWYPWGEEALSKAKQENKPILLSIGYSACHWCHVMAQESFADAETAEIMNQHFINIKVDREERPDLDKIYQRSHQLLTRGSGGWPLTVFLTPGDHMPFFAGTYFPKVPRFGLPSFKELLLHIAQIFQQQKVAIEQQNFQLKEFLQQLDSAKASSTETLSEQPIKIAYDFLASEFDAVHGGFGAAPKFPRPDNLEFLLYYWLRNKNQQALTMLHETLIKMAQGGIYDQLGGGFYRYSIDAEWQIPHFEKMLYDNAQLLNIYAQANFFLQEPILDNVISETADWLLREMRAPEGNFYSTLDADSEHVEGKFYYWDKEQIKKLLTMEEYQIAELYFGLDLPPNFENKHWHLRAARKSAEIAKKLSADENNIIGIIKSVQQKLLAARVQRIRPGRDEKMLTAWNALLVKGLLSAGLRLQRRDLIEKAQQILKFIYQNLWKNGRLLACCKNNKAYLNAYLDDYAFLLDALIFFLQINWCAGYLNWAIEIAEVLLRHFYDRENGGFFFTGDDHEQLIHRLKTLQDEATPAGNNIAALALSRLGHLLGETRYLQATEQTLHTAWQAVTQWPAAHCSLLNTLEEYLYPPQLIILRGEGEALKIWHKTCLQAYNPHRLLFAIPITEQNLPGIFQQYSAKNKQVTAYICVGGKCLEPIIKLEKLKIYLKLRDSQLF